MSRNLEQTVDLIAKIAAEEALISSRLSISDQKEPRLSESLDKHKDHFEKQRLKAAGAYLRLQRIFAFLLFGLVAIWLFMVIAAVFCNGFQFLNFRLSDSVLIAFITSTTPTFASP